MLSGQLPAISRTDNDPIKRTPAKAENNRIRTVPYSMLLPLQMLDFHIQTYLFSAEKTPVLLPTFACHSHLRANASPEKRPKENAGFFFI